MRAGAVILAAGAATRMGRIKQLLPYRGRTLLEHAIENACEAGFAPIVVVLGAQADAVGKAIQHAAVTCVTNADWQSGMGSSLTAGVHKLLEIAPDLPALVVLLADQPCIAAHHLSAMWREFEQTHTPIVAAAYAETLGVPAIFRRSVFTKLENLKPDAGARSLLRDEGIPVARYELPEAAADVDTPEDFAALPT